MTTELMELMRLAAIEKTKLDRAKSAAAQAHAVVEACDKSQQVAWRKVCVEVDRLAKIAEQAPGDGE